MESLQHDEKNFDSDRKSDVLINTTLFKEFYLARVFSLAICFIKMKIPKIKVEGLDIPIIGLGTWGLKGDECFRTVLNALQIGYRLIDSAEIYGNELEIGRAIKKSGIPRKQIIITTKVYPDGLSYEKVISSFEGSLERLGTDYIDIYLLHWPRKGMDLKGIMKAFKSLKDGGKIKIAGVSNFDISEIDELEQIGSLDVVRINQIEIHPKNYPEKLIEYCRKKKIFLQAYSPLNRGELVKNKALKDIGEKYFASPSQVALSFLFGKEIIALPKASSSAHLRENMGAVEIKLDRKDVRKIEELS